MRIGVPKETVENETRVAIVPISIPKLKKLGWRPKISLDTGIKLTLEYFENLLQNPVDVEIVSEHVNISESIAVNSGLYNFITNGKTINARFSFVYGKDNTEWKIISHHSSILPEN